MVVVFTSATREVNIRSNTPQTLPNSAALALLTDTEVAIDVAHCHELEVEITAQYVYLRTPSTDLQLSISTPLFPTT
jgi:hypothetical protein